MCYAVHRPGTPPESCSVCHPDAWLMDAPRRKVEMFGDSMFDEEERLRRSADGQADGAPEQGQEDHEELVAFGGLDEHLRRRQAISQLLREVGGC